MSAPVDVLARAVERLRAPHPDHAQDAANNAAAIALDELNSRLAGMVLVPREPTPEMISACITVWQERLRRKAETGTLLCGGNPEQSFRENWAAMLAAVPLITIQDCDVSVADFATAMRNCGLSLKTFAEVDRESRRLAKERTALARVGGAK